MELPASVELAVADTEPGIQGDRVSGARKSATLVTGYVCRSRCSSGRARSSASTPAAASTSRAPEWATSRVRATWPASAPCSSPTRRSIKARDVDEVIAALPVDRPDAYTVGLLRAARDHRERADELIARHARDWAIDRLAAHRPAGDGPRHRRAAACDDPPPVAVVLDEAVSLAKEYSTDDSGAFVNGVLSSCVADLH